MNAQHRIGSRGVPVLLVVLHDHLIMMLPPSEDVVPVTQIVGYHRQSVTPGLHDGLHIVERVLVPLHQTLVNLVCLLEFHDLQAKSICIQRTISIQILAEF